MLTTLKKLLTSKKSEIDEWFNVQWKDLTPQIYLSCDLRHSGHKIAVVDTNLYPGGFNNLCKAYSRQTAEAFKAYLDKYYPHAKKILIYGEEHTRNKFYLKNLSFLRELIIEAGRDACVGVFGQFLPESTLKVDFEDISFTLHKIEKAGNKIICSCFEPDLILSNNDFSTGIPDLFDGITQEIIPSPHLGWHQRKKHGHFVTLEKVLQDFSKIFQIDSWFFSSYIDLATDVDFTNQASLESLATKVEEVIEKIRQKHQEYQIKDDPYVYLKSNMGTYGLGLLPVFSGEDILRLNRKQRNKLLSLRGGIKGHEYLIQEGIPTADFYSEHPIEPVIYVVGREPVGGFFRIHESKNQLESLNAPGMTFSCLCLHKLDEPHEEFFLRCHEKESVVLLSQFLTRLAALAASMELKELR